MIQFATLVVAPVLLLCPCCGRLSPSVEKRSRNTCYLDDDLNYLVSCLECFQMDWDYYQERWEDYWSERF